MESSINPTQPKSESWFPFTKFKPPHHSINPIARVHLQPHLKKAVLTHRLTLVAAPAGSGKTVLCSSLTSNNWTTVWVSLDENDNDLILFVTLLVTGTSSLLINAGRSILTFLQTVPSLADKTSQLAALLINNLQSTNDVPIVLILDDFHTISDPTIHLFLTHLIDYLPDTIRIVISTRHDPPIPLARLRARKHLAEIRLPQLLFDEAETADFLNKINHLELSNAEVRRLHKRTEGWAAGLQLLAAVLSSLTNHTSRADFIHNLSHSNRSIFDFLATEVLLRQPIDVQDFLLETSILPDLTPENCRVVTGNPNAPDILNFVFQQNLFLRALSPDSLNGPFRYHDLFRDFLQHRLRLEKPHQWVELHQRAIGATNNDEQKLYHLIKAEKWEQAAQLLESMAHVDNERRFTRSFVITSIESLPSEVQLSHPWLLLQVAQYYAVRGQTDKAAPWQAIAENQFRENNDKLGEIELLIIRAIVDTLDSESIINRFRQIALTSRHLMRPDHWSFYHGGEQWYALGIHDWLHVTEHTQANIELALNHNDQIVLTNTSMSIGPHMVFCNGGMILIEKFATQALNLAGKDNLILQLCALGLLGAVRFFQGRLEEAEKASTESLNLLQEIGGLAWIDHHVCWVIMSAMIAHRNYLGFHDFISKQAARWEIQDTAPVYQQGIMYLQGRSFWLQGRTAEAQTVLEKMNMQSEPTGYDVEDRLRRLLLGSMISMSKGETEKAKNDLRIATTQHEKIRHTIMLSHPRLALATLYSQLNQWDDAMHELKLTLTELKTRQIPGVILQEGESIVPLLSYAINQGIENQILQPLLQLLQPTETSKILSIPNSSEHLTARESEVLKLMTTGATNPAIAAELFITERTVKAHVTRILAKLKAETRTEAVNKARKVGII